MNSKVAFYCLMFVIFASIAFGDELKSINTGYTLSVANNTITIAMEGTEYNFPNSCTGSATYQRSFNILKNVSCTSEQLLNQYQSALDVFSNYANDSIKYYDKYLNCYASEKLCQDRILNSVNSTHEDYLQKYLQINEDLGNCKQTSSGYVQQRQKAESDLSVCQTEKKSVEDSRMIIGIICILVGAGGYHFISNKGGNKPAVSVAERQLPKNR